MKTIKKFYYLLLGTVKRSKKLNELAQYAYLKLSKVFGMRARKSDRLLFGSPSQKGSTDKRPRVAFICDEMTWQDFCPFSDCVFLHPKVWKKQLEQFQPDVFFCESAWSGIEAYANVWRGRIYRDRRVSFENRDVLMEILAYCRKKGIKTVFWNKEDPVYFDHPIYDFADTALRFDHIFTTAGECIDGYRAGGHNSVTLLPFGVNTQMFYPAKNTGENNRVMFAGSWFAEHTGRSEALEKLLDYAIAQGWQLDIYDRNSNNQEGRFSFPEKYAPYLRPAVSFSEMPDIYRQYNYAINVNTVVNSPTMLSRRVLQLAASGITILSNDAQGLQSLSDCLQICPMEEAGIVLIRPDVQAMQKHASSARLRTVLETVFLEESANE